MESLKQIHIGTHIEKMVQETNTLISRMPRLSKSTIFPKQHCINGLIKIRN